MARHLRPRWAGIAAVAAVFCVGLVAAFAATGVAAPQQTTTSTTSSTSTGTTSTTSSTSTTASTSTSTSTSTPTATTTSTSTTTSTTPTSTVTVTVTRPAQFECPGGRVGLPGGGTSVPAQNVAPPDRLLVDRVRFSPNPLRSRSSIVTGRFHVADVRCGFSVRGALVYAIGLPYGEFRVPVEVTTGTDGWAVAHLVPGPKLRVVRGGAAVVFLRARKPGDALLAGVSIRRLVQLRVRP
jgi:hypothetical protein